MMHTSVLRLVVACCALSAVPDAVGQEAINPPHGVVSPGHSRSSTRDAPKEALQGLTADDWSGIRSAYDAARHAVHPVDGGYRARNHGQRWATRFDGRGFTAEPDTGAWTWGLELVCYGFAGHEREAIQPVCVTADGQRVAYDWGAGVSEWYINDTDGLEHGFTVHQRPHDPTKGEDGGPLRITLAVRGGLSSDVAEGGRNVRFLDDDGTPVLTYSGLAVFDSDGRELRASFERVGKHLLLSVDELGARYPLTIDPIAQQAYLKASNTGSGDQFGLSVAVSGDTVVVGAPREDSNATGVNGDGTDNSDTDSGAAYVFVRSGTTWREQAYLKASNTDAGDFFGFSVAVAGDTVVVGASSEDSSASGVGGDESDNSLFNSGAAYVFERSGTLWSQQAYLKASNSGWEDSFGYRVALSGDTLVVGAINEDSDATGVNGDQVDDSASGSGAAYVFVRNGSAWAQQAYLKASNTDATDNFGFSVAASGDTIVVGAWKEDSSATGVDGAQGDSGPVFDAGAAYVFARDPQVGLWSQQAYLKASNTGQGDYFGYSVSVSDDTVVAGAYSEDSNATGVNGDQSNEQASTSGAAYVFVRIGALWSQEAYLKASNTGGFDSFGFSVSVSGDTVLVGAPGEASDATGLNGDGTDNSYNDSGAAYVFVRSGTTWSQQAYVKASNTGQDDDFGWSVSLSDETVLVGAPSEDGGATGVDGNQVDNSATQAGAAYALAPSTSAWSDQGCALEGIFGDPLLVGGGTLASGSTNSIDLGNAARSALAGMFVALSSTPTPFKGGTLKAIPPLTPPVMLTTDATGSISLPFRMPPGVPPGTDLWVQWAIQDAAAISGVALSNAILGITP